MKSSAVRKPITMSAKFPVMRTPSFSPIPSFPSSLTTSRRYIQQHRDQVLSTHGSFLTRHQSIADKDLASKAPTGTHQVVGALPAADLFRSKVHEGLGTSEKDPYDRTLPNMESIPPATTVLYSSSIQAPNQEEKEHLERRWHLLRVWWDADYPRMPLFLEKQKLSNVPPISSTVEEMLLEFRDTVLPSLSSNPEEVTKLQEWWASAQETYKRCGSQFVLNKSRFMKELQHTHDHVMRSISDSSGKEQFSVALEVLRRKSMAEHNAALRHYYHCVAHRENGLPRQTANEMWEIFLTNMQEHQTKIFVKTTDGPLWFAWEALLVEPHLRPPSMTAPVALLFALVTLQLKQRAAASAAGEILSSSTAYDSDGTKNRKMRHPEKEMDLSLGSTAVISNSATSPAALMRRYHRYVSIITRRRFVLEALMKMFLTTPVEVDVLAAKFRSEGELETARDLSLCAAMLTNTDLLHAEAASVVAPFSSTSEVKSVFASIYGGKDEGAKKHLCTTLGISPSSTTGTGSSSGNTSHKRRQINWDEVMETVDWKNQWKSLVIALLIHPPFLQTVHTYVKNAIGAKGVERELFHPNVAEQLDRIKQARAAREESSKRSTDALILKLSSYEWVDRTLRFLLEMESSASTSRYAALSKERQNILEPEAVAAEQEEALKRSLDTPVSAEALAATFEAVQLRHPQWVKSGVLPSLFGSMEDTNKNPSANDHEESNPHRGSRGSMDEQNSSKVLKYFMADPFAGLRVLTRIFIRLAYVPQAGAAMIAQRTRRRIGPVGLKPTEFNIPAECGIVEQFDNLLYKRYDWQGWYQRMVDIHNRNVSLRCRLDDLRKLDAYGNPFVDLQTERRLRILCGERVGMSVLKLDSDKYEDQKDNITYGVTKLSEILAESRKAQLGMEYWPTVEVKVRRPSGQSQAYYSVLDDDRIEKESKTLYESYKEQKKRSLFVTPMNLWLKTKGTQTHAKTDLTDEEGYSVASLHASMNEDDSDSTPS